MAGLILKNKCRWIYLHYYAIAKDKLPISYSPEFGYYLTSLMLQVNSISHRIEDSDYFTDMPDVSIAEQWLLNYLNTFDESLTIQDMNNFFRGSKLLPGGDPMNQEQHFWII